MRSNFKSVLVALIAILTFGCGGGGGGGGGVNKPGLVIQPATITIRAGEKVQFNATLDGAPAAAAAWSVSAASGTVDANGLYTSPTVTGTYTVTVSSPGVPTKTATVFVKPPLRFLISALDKVPGVGQTFVLARASSTGEYQELLSGPFINRAFASPDGSHMFVSAQIPSRSIIYRLNIDGTGLTPLVNDGVAGYILRGVDWTRGKIVYLKLYGVADEQVRLYMANLDGSNEVLLTNGPLDDEFTPAGSKYLYTEHVPTADEPEMYIAQINHDGTSKVRLLPQSFNPISDWGETSFVFQDFVPVYGPNGIYDIRRANMDGTGVVNLTNTVDQSELLPAWSRDNTEIVYSRIARQIGVPYETNGQVWIMNSDGTQQRQLIDLSSRGLDSIYGFSILPD